MEVSIVIEEQTLGMIGVADLSPREWGEAERKSLDDAAAAVATEVRLRLAKRDAARAQTRIRRPIAWPISWELTRGNGSSTPPFTGRSDAVSLTKIASRPMKTPLVGSSCT